MAVSPLMHGGFKVPGDVSAALQKASRVTGVDFQYLLDTAARESGFRPRVQAKTSSASGLFQFIESTWLQMVKEHGSTYGLAKEAQQISKTRSGRYVVADPSQRQAILNLRNKPEVAAVMAGAFTQLNAQHMEGVLGRKATPGELYIAHFLGAGNGGKLVKAAALRPELKAADLFPSAARSNKSLFYKKGQAVGVRELYHKLVRRHQVVTKSVEGQKADVPLPIRKTVDFPSHAVASVVGVQRTEGGQLTASSNLNLDPVVSSEGGRIGIWGGRDLVHPGAGVREHQALHRGDAVQGTPLMEELGSSQLVARGLFLKGGLGRKS